MVRAAAAGSGLGQSPRWRCPIRAPWWAVSCALLLWVPGSLLSATISLLSPPDTSSPRATFTSFRELTNEIAERYVDYREAPSAHTQQTFVHAVEQGKQLMDLSAVPPAVQREIGTASIIWLWEVIARVDLPDTEQIPDAAAYAGDGDLADHPARWRLPDTNIVIARAGEGPRAGEFLFSPETIASARAYAEIARELPYRRSSRIENVKDLTATALGFSGWMLPSHLIERLPGWARQPIAGQVAWKWGLTFASLGLTLVLLVLLLRWSRRRPWDARPITLMQRLSAPLALLLWMPLLRTFLDDQVRITGLVIAWPDYLAELTRVVALVWMVLLISRWIPEAMIASPRRTADSLDASLLRWVARVFSLMVILGLLFAAAQDLGIPVFGLVAGAGVGGLAIALAARPTLENFIGALNLFADRPIRVGDLCRFDERHGQGWNPVGTVEAIGLRSTRVRQFDGSLITIPNADLAERNIVNHSVCETFLLQQRIPLRYETSADQLRYLLANLRELLHAHPMTIHTEDYPIRTRFLGFRDQALTMELRTYIRTKSYTEFLAIQEDIMLRVMQAIQQAGTGFALPAQTLYMTRDPGLDPDQRAAAERQVREWAAAHELPFPDLDEAQRKRITGTLDYPPEGSPGAERGYPNRNRTAQTRKGSTKAVTMKERFCLVSRRSSATGLGKAAGADPGIEMGRPAATSRFCAKLAHTRTAALFMLMCLPTFTAGADASAAPTPAVLFENVAVLDGRADALTEPLQVLVVGNRIERISTDPIEPPDGLDLTRIDGGGRTLMPGLIDAHTHVMYATLSRQTLLTSDIGFLNVAATKAARDMLLRGFTSIRDLGGPVFGLKRGIDRGLVPGPRIWPAGAFISQSGGHGDFRLPYELPAAPDAFSYSERIGAALIADGADEVRKRTREQLALGASQIKLMAGGGVASIYDPLDVTQYTVPELRAAVEAAENWGTYVTVHAYTPRAVRQAIEAGVQCIEHGQLLNEETVRLIAEHDLWWSLQPFIDDQPSPYAEGSANRRKQLAMYAGTDRAYRLARQFDIKTAWGTDILFNAANATRQGAKLAVMERWYTPAEVLRMATSGNAELLALSGPRSPYEGKLGVVEEGALADLLLVDGNPLEDLSLVADPASNFLVIMKDGELYKNLLAGD